MEEKKNYFAKMKSSGGETIGLFFFVNTKVDICLLKSHSTKAYLHLQYVGIVVELMSI